MWKYLANLWGNFSYTWEQSNVTGNCERNFEKPIFPNFRGIGKIFEMKVSFHTCQKWFEIRYKFVNFIFVGQTAILTWVTLYSFDKCCGCSSFKYMFFFLSCTILYPKICVWGLCYWVQQVAMRAWLQIVDNRILIS